MDRQKFIGTVAKMAVVGSIGTGLDFVLAAENKPDIRKKGPIPRRILGKTGVEVSC